LALTGSDNWCLAWAVLLPLLCLRLLGLPRLVGQSCCWMACGRY
jgi:hypothetical protein